MLISGDQLAGVGKTVLTYVVVGFFCFVGNHLNDCKRVALLLSTT